MVTSDGSIVKHNHEIDVDANEPAICVISADNGISAVPPAGMNDDNVFPIRCVRQDNICKPITDMAGIIHSIKPTLGSAFFEQFLIPIGIRHRGLNGLIVNKACRAGINREAVIDTVFVHFRRNGIGIPNGCNNFSVNLRS